ncbi:MAG: hypothetical protein KBG01_07865 [Syntrophobacterales bacterium]|nr:hypothetical protein [Syntrophobacterales bacterium]
MAKAKAGDKLSCGVCGLVVTVDEACGCASIEELVCCGEVMKKGELAARRARKAAATAAPAVKKTAAKEAKPAAKKKAVAKTTAKKTVAKKK